MLKRRQIRTIKRAFRKLFKRTWNSVITVSKSVVDWFLRTVLLIGVSKGRQAHAKAGFVLPTVALLLVVVALVIGSILFRTGSRTNQVINERNQQVIYNAATPAIDRAKAKLEYLFKKDDRLPNTTPSEAQLLSAILNDGQNGISQLPDADNPYKFVDETQVQLAGQNAPAWKYNTDVDGNGTNETVVYSILLKTKDPLDASNPSVKREDSGPNATKNKADKLVVRNGPITVQKAADPDCDRLNLAPESGWDLVGTGSLRKTFQVDAVVVSNNNGNRTVSTLEFQQDRELARANKWGAWFRYDLHIYPTPPFRWNGAMHTEGSLYLGPTNADSIQSYLISARTSCLYNPASNSEITLGRIEANNTISFAGQVVNGALGISGRNQEATVHIHGDPQDSTSSTTKISGGTDSVSSGSLKDYALNPVILFTEDKSKAVGGSGTGIEYSVDRWRTEETLTNTRLRANSEDPPYVDDTYRADDRLGPKPKFNLEGRDNDFELNDSNRKNGTPISSAGLNSDQLDQMTRNDPKPNDDERKTIGLDGYWERRARLEGLRILVGQRLELGNTNGWGTTDFNGDDTQLNRGSDANEFDPLYPIYKSQLPNPPSNPTGIPHLQQQRRSLRDNLAAVQATAVYHYIYMPGDNKGYFPVACLATTAHPGTQTTIDNSKNFSLAARTGNPNSYYYQYDPNGLISDFFTGRGTNGWEFNIAPRSEFQNSGSEIRKALKNLGNFAGDYVSNTKSGAFPPTQEGGRVHPDPYLAMWGNFSNLRRAIQDPANNPLDGQMSLADQSYMHTAGCALGMLAYNVNYFEKYDKDKYAANRTELETLNTALQADLGSGADKGLADGTTPDMYISKLTLSANDKKLVLLINQREQIARDRKFGFAASPGSKLRGFPTSTPLPAQPNKYQYVVQYIGDVPVGSPAETFEFGGKIYTKLGDDVTNFKTFNSGCDFSSATGNNFFGYGTPLTKDDEKRFIRLATAFCSTQPKFPSLYYVFPTDTHDRTSGAGITQPNTEPYIDRTTGANDIPINGNFEQVNIASLADQFRPKNTGEWILPTGGSPNVTLNPDTFKITRPETGDLYVPFLDKGVFDGREMLSTRFLDIDLNRLRQNTVPPENADNWFPRTGIIYAFREDAVREDAIARPNGGDYTDPNSPIKSDARSTENPTDPQVKNNGISPKPVDFYPDPDRRTYGFRLRNGEDLRREQSNPRGITFISDNPVAILGNFNLHSQEEFTQTLNDDFSNFYTRDNLNSNFATTGGDTWRTAEILTDALYTLSNNFVDGTIEDGLRNNGNMSYRGLGSNPRTSPPVSPIYWIREDGSASEVSSASSIKIFRDGNPRHCQNQAPPINYCRPENQTLPVIVDADLSADTRRDNLNAATRTEINTVIVGGTVPARENQGNGGLNNFPRFLENWNGRDLKIRGSFIQLNFSTYSTASYDQDAFEPDLNPDAAERAFHSRPPNRLWGYDVALQYAPAGPLSRRFITAETPRSEFYEEPKANDPYICNLRKAIAGDTSQGLESQAQVNQECP
ncbi:hormogonium polysaccharide biosynthesis protein HpsA [Floridanema evergladense]|uniref:Hormogonium polysaccharide biosynthesis protein HpsA n=1 Tax=Floridaenema evergladense BLCC-F167 TaxID=3153639 RepID=A0ABV4WRY9_9CYAN